MLSSLLQPALPRAPVKPASFPPWDADENQSSAFVDPSRLPDHAQDQTDVNVDGAIGEERTALGQTEDDDGDIDGEDDDDDDDEITPLLPIFSAAHLGMYIYSACSPADSVDGSDMSHRCPAGL